MTQLPHFSHEESHASRPYLPGVVRRAAGGPPRFCRRGAAGSLGHSACPTRDNRRRALRRPDRGKHDGRSSLPTREVIREVLFKDGAEIKKGDALFQLDHRPYRAELEKAQAVVARAEARLKLADADLQAGQGAAGDRGNRLEELNKLTVVQEESRACAASRTRALALAKQNLEYTRIAAPINGKIGRSLFDAGNVVSQDSALATIVVLRAASRTLRRGREYLAASPTPIERFSSQRAEGRRPGAHGYRRRCFPCRL